MNGEVRSCGDISEAKSHWTDSLVPSRSADQSNIITNPRVESTERMIDPCVNPFANEDSTQKQWFGVRSIQLDIGESELFELERRMARSSRMVGEVQEFADPAGPMLWSL